MAKFEELARMDTPTLIAIAEKVGNISTAIILAIFAFFSIVQVLLFFEVPLPWISKQLEAKEARRFDTFLQKHGQHFKSQIPVLLDEFYTSEASYIAREHDTLAHQILQMAGITRDSFAKIRAEIIELCYKPMGTSPEREQAILSLCKKPPILVDTTQLKEPLYREVKYYLNFVDAVADEHLGPYIGDVLANHIKANVRPEIIQSAAIVVPVRGNALLGVYVARALRRDVVLLRNSPRLCHGQYWDGVLADSCPIIIVHDVAVTGDQLVQAHQLLSPRGHSILGVYCLVERIDKIDYNAMETRNLKLFSITKLNELAITPAVSQ